MGKNQRFSVNFWAFLQNVLIHSMSKGQFPGACVTGLIALLILKLPAEKAAEVVDRILLSLRTSVGVSYTFNVVLVVSWAIHARWQRTSMTQELKRMGQEKSALQEQLLERPLSSSNQ